MRGDEFNLGPNKVRVLYDSSVLGLAEGLFAPGIPGPAPHSHDWDEGFYVVSGELLVTVDGVEQKLGSGQFAMASGGAVHTFRTISAEPALFVATFGPRGIAYLRDMAGAFTSSGPDPERLRDLHERYGVEVPD